MSQKSYPAFRWFVLFALLFGTIANGVILIWPAPLMQHIAEALHADLGAVTGALMVAFTILVSVFAVIGGICLDRFGFLPTMLVSLGVMTVATLLVPFCSHSFGAMVLVRMLQGAGGGPTMAAVGVVAVNWFPINQRGIVTGIQGVGISLGIALGFAFVPMAFMKTGSFAAAAAWMALFPIVSILLFLVVAFGPKPPVHDAVEDGLAPDAEGDFKVASKLPVFYVGIILIFLFSWLGQAFNDLTPVYLSAPSPLGMGHGMMVAGKFMGMVQVANMIGSVVGGLIMAKVLKGNAKIAVCIGFLLVAVAAYAVKSPAVAGNLGVLPLAMLAAGFFQGWVAPNVMGFASMHFPSHIVGKICGIWMGLGIFGGTVGVVVGATLLHKTGGYQASLSMVALVSLVGFLGTLFLNPPAVFSTAKKGKAGLSLGAH
ncbi:MAG: rane protein, major facilitator superfamily [Holophagaceae bacterium]|nr:rane protein, major facilitator superfamily [Holophagaceae bacterium]